MLVLRSLGVSMEFIGEDVSDVSDKVVNPGGLVVVDAEKKRMENKPLQAVRFVVLSWKIFKAVDRSKRS